MEWLINNKILFLIFLESGSLRTWGQYGQVPMRTLSQVARSWLLIVSSHGWKSKLDLSPHFRRVPIPHMKVPLWWSNYFQRPHYLIPSYWELWFHDMQFGERQTHFIYRSLEPAMRDYLWEYLSPPVSSFLRRLCVIYFCFSLLPYTCLLITKNNYLWEIIRVLSSIFYFPPRKEKTKW